MTDLKDILSKEEFSHTAVAEMPVWMEPMLAKLTHAPFSDNDWIYERKLDGERVLCYRSPEGSIRMLSRNRKQINDSYPEIERALADQMPRGMVLDGEVIAFGNHGTSDFQKLQPRMQASSREQAEEEGIKVFYYVFDCLYAQGRYLSRCSLRSRKKALRQLVNWTDPLVFTQHRNGDGMKYYREACRKGWEGVIAKKADSEYAHGRSGNWLKFKCVHRQEFVIGGYTGPEGHRDGFGALLIGYYSGNELVYAGKVGTGFDDETLLHVSKELKKLKRDTPPFNTDPDEKKAHYVEPELVCEIAFTEWTSDCKLRHPAYKGLRRDKEAGHVVREDKSAVPEPERSE